MRLISRFLSAQNSKSLADVTRRKGRTLLVVLGIFIGVAGLTSINVTEDALYNALSFTVGTSANQPDIYLAVDQLNLALQPALAAVPNVRAVQYESRFQTNWQTSASTETALQIVSYPNLQQVSITPFQLTSGTYPAAGEIVMEYGDQGLHPVGVGNLIAVQTAHGTAQLHVVGLARTHGVDPTSSGIALAYMNDTALSQLTAGIGHSAPNSKPPTYDQVIAVKTRLASQSQTTAAALQQVLQAHQVTVFAVNIPDANNTAATLKTVTGVFSLVRLLAILAVVLSGILLLNTITALVAEQIAIIGSMKAAGATRGVIMRGYLVSVGLYSALGTLPGLALGLFGGFQLANTLGRQVVLAIGPFTIEPWIIALGLALGFGVPLLAALLPLWNGTRITVREAISGYGVSAGTEPVAFLRLGQWLTWVPQTIWLGMRHLFRKRWRLALTLLTLTITGASFLVVQTATTSVNATVGAVNSHSAADMTVYFNNPSQYNQISAQLSALPNVVHIERVSGGHTTTPWGTIELFGYEPTTQIYHYQLTSGRWLRPDDTTVILLSDDAAARTGLHAGDTLILGTTPLMVIGTVHQTISVSGWIGAAILPVNTLYEMNGIPPATVASTTQEIDIEGRTHTPGAENQLAQQVNRILNPTGRFADGTGYFGGDNGTIDTTHEYVTRRQHTWDILYYMLYALALLVGVVGILGLANALTASVLERRREIGMLRALGANSWQVAQVFWVESLTQGSLAWGLGVLVGVPLAIGFVYVLAQSVMPVDFALDATAFLVMLVAMVLIATLASIVPAWRASRVRIAGILRYE